MGIIPTKKSIENKVRRDTVHFQIRNAKTKQVTFSKPFTSPPNVIITMFNSHPYPEISNVKTTGFRMAWSTNGNYEGRWEAFPFDDE